MSTLTIENIPPQLYARLEREAVHHRRSLTQQVLWFLEQGLMRNLCEPVEIDEKTQWLEPIKPVFPISSDSIISVIREGRDERTLFAQDFFSNSENEDENLTRSTL
ncbi:MAG: hypothetical protein DRR16_16045 [Candidatus Parabeggiatoa sp. nov. 3]|nr:MAG: hypothetical protein DRR00_15415 [Gammaproteobacteria bacterium]RKZ66553.1 MAG: hypothetical protein DRQ99_09355 [Gammaproteobacteria bacterium]RKZ83942.1 MAG: hypothetical protein DRR16_16045 [Gammaproteobacteria bacterium]